MTDMTNSKNSTEIKKLDSATASFLEGLSSIFSTLDLLPLPKQRAAIKFMSRMPENRLEPIEKAENLEISGRHGPIKIRILTPKKEGILPIIVYLHKGGWVFGSIEESEKICRKMANQLEAIVVAVEYHLAPEYKFPIPLEDCYDATKWIVQNATNFSGNPKKVILCGESAGGNLAAGVALMNCEKNEFSLFAQLLLYPVLTNDLNKEHYDNSPDKAIISLKIMQFYFDAYLTSPKEGENPYVSPLKSKDLSRLPPTFIVTAEHDALKHEGAAYAAALQKAGVPVKVKCYPGVIHGFLDLSLADATKKEAMQDIQTWVEMLTR